MSKYITATNIRYTIADVLIQVETTKEPVLIKRFTKTMCAIISIEDYRILQKIKDHGNINKSVDYSNVNEEIETEKLPDNIRYFSIKEAVKFLHRSYYWIDAQILNGNIKAEFIGKRRMIAREELIRIMNLDNKKIVYCETKSTNEVHKKNEETCVKNNEAIESGNLPDDVQFFTINEVLKFLKVSYYWITKQILSGNIKMEYVNHRKFITREELIRLNNLKKKKIDSYGQPTTSEVHEILDSDHKNREHLALEQLKQDRPSKFERAVDKKLFRLREAANYLGYSTRWLNRRLEKGIIKTVHVGGMPYITREELMRVSHPSKKEFCTISEAANYIGLSVSTIRMLIKTGKMPCSKEFNKILIKRSDLDSILKEGT